MKVKNYFYTYFIFIFFPLMLEGQNVSLYSQFNGRYDFTFVGNTMNLGENNIIPGCSDLIVNSSSANLNLNPSQTLIAAYLYWAGSGTGDFNVKLNAADITPDRTFSNISINYNLPYFSAFKDITNEVLFTGNGTYTLSDLDVSQALIDYPNFCNFRTNFAGWAIIIVYEDISLPINQINVYDGLQSIPNSLNITLNSLNVIDNIGAKIGFLAWEGDNNLAVNETLRLNSAILSNALNPPNNAFNGTNTVTGSATQYNMDLDIYDIQNNINPGDTSALIQLTSGQDVVLINTIITKLNSQLPDATITIDAVNQECNSRDIIVDYTVSNLNATDILPANTPIAIYANGIFIQATITNSPIQIGASVSNQIVLSIPNSIPSNFTLQFVVDDSGNGIGIVSEIVETNNSYSTQISLLISPEFNILNDIYTCVYEISNTIIDFSNYINYVLDNQADEVQFFNSLNDATTNSNPITNISSYTVNIQTTLIYVRIDNLNCFSITSFSINLVLFPEFNTPLDITICRENENTAFDFSSYSNSVLINPTDTVHFFENVSDANNNINTILNTNAYLPATTPKEIFVRIDNNYCYSTVSFTLDYYELPTFNTLEDLITCNEGLTKGTFDFSSYEELIKTDINDIVSFYTSFEDATNQTNEILNSYSYEAITTPKEIFVRIEDDFCFSITSFLLIVENCPPIVYNAVSPNNDGLNDGFFIEGLRDIFINFRLEIYNRWGKLLWIGDNNKPDWDGYVAEGIGSKVAPAGTYFYILYLNDPSYHKNLSGYLYLNK